MMWLFSYPVLLFALLSLAIPIFIHLFSHDKGQRIKVGSLQFFQSPKPIQQTKIQLVEKLLLFVRLLLLICATLLISQLWWQDDNSSLSHKNNPEKKHVTNSANNSPQAVDFDFSKDSVLLLSSRWLANANKQAKQALVDQAKAKQLSTFFLHEQAEKAQAFNQATDFSTLAQLKPLTYEDIIEWPSEHSDISRVDHQVKPQVKPIWRSLLTASYQLPSNAVIEVFTDNSYAQFIGKMPNISQTLRWHMVNNDSSKSIKHTLNQPISVTIIADAKRQYAQHQLIRALEVIKSQLLPNLMFEVIENIQDFKNFQTNNLDTINDNQWLFYLSSDQQNDVLINAFKQGLSVFIDAQQEQEFSYNQESTYSQEVMSDGDYLFSNFTLKKIESVTDVAGNNLTEQLAKQLLLKNSQLILGAKQIIWRTASQQPLLTKQDYQVALNDKLTGREKSNTPEFIQGQLIKFNSRFEKEWSDLAEQAQFVRVVLALLTDEIFTPLQANLAQILAQQLDEKIQLNALLQNDSYLSFEQKTKLFDFTKQPLTQWLAAILVVLWLMERLLSEYSRASKFNKKNKLNEENKRQQADVLRGEDA